MQKINDINELLPEILIIKQSCNLMRAFWPRTCGEEISGYKVCIVKQKIVRSFILGYVPLKIKTKFHEISRKLHFGLFRNFRANKNFFGKSNSITFFCFYILSLNKISEKRNKPFHYRKN